MKTKICEYSLCGKEFEVPSTYPNKRFCCPSCGYKNRTTRPKPYSVISKCKCGCETEILNPDDHYRYRKFLPEHRNSGGTHPRLGYKESEQETESRMKKVFSSFNKRKPTCIERQLYVFLESIGVEYFQQYRIGRFVPDAYVPSINLCIFADGKYWHSKKEVIARDERCNSYLLSLGYKVIRLPSIDNGYSLDLDELRVALTSDSFLFKKGNGNGRISREE